MPSTTGAKQAAALTDLGGHGHAHHPTDGHSLTGLSGSVQFRRPERASQPGARQVQVRNTSPSQLFDRLLIVEASWNESDL
jgi:hypothetical protein